MLALRYLTLFAMTSLAAAQDWHGAGELHWDARLPLVIENPTAEAHPAALVQIPLGKLQAALPDVHPLHIGLVDPKALPFRFGEHGGTLVPFQVKDNILSFVVALQPGEKKTFHLYSSAATVQPAFEKKTGLWEFEAYKFFENNLMAFRTEVGPAASTQGLTIDLWGKTPAGRGLQVRRFLAFQQEPLQQTYHKISKWGMDIFHIGPSAGMGGIYLMAGDQVIRPNSIEAKWEVVEEGPVLSMGRITAPIETKGKKLTVVRTVTVNADDRGVDDLVEIRGDAADLDGLLIGIGLRNFQKEHWTEFPKDGYALVSGAQGQPGVDEVGIGMVFDPAAYVRTDKADTKEGAQHILIFKPSKCEGGVTVRQRFGGYWDKDIEVAKRADFEKWLQRWAKLRAAPPRVDFSVKAEKAPAEKRRAMDPKPVAVNPSAVAALLPPFTAVPPQADPPKGGQLVEFGGQRLVFADVRLKPFEIRLVELTAGGTSGFKVDRSGNSASINNGWATWKFDGRGLAAIERNGKTLKVRDSAGEAGEIKVAEGPAVCVVSIGKRQWLLARNSPAWQVNSPPPYSLSVDRGSTEKIYYAHLDASWNPRLHVRQFEEALYLFFPGDFTTVFNGEIGLGVTIVPTAAARRWAITQPDKTTTAITAEHFAAEMKKGGRHECVGTDSTFGLAADPARCTAFFAVAEAPTAGEEALKASAPAMLMEKEGERLWIHRADLAGGGVLGTVRCEGGGARPDFDNATWIWNVPGDGSCQGKCSFGSVKDNETGKTLRTVAFHGDVDNLWPDGFLNDLEQKFPILIANDWSGKGEFAHGTLFNGGVVSSGGWRMKGIRKHYTSEWTPYLELNDQFAYRTSAQTKADCFCMNVFDLDGDGDLDVIDGDREGVGTSLVLDYGDMNPLVMTVYDPTRGYAMGNGANLSATYTDNFVEYHGGTTTNYEGREVLVGGHDWPQMVFSADDKPSPTHRIYLDAHGVPEQGGLSGAKWMGDKWLEYYHPHRWVMNLANQRKDVDGYSYVNFEFNGGRHWNSCMYVFDEADYPDGLATGVKWESPVSVFKDALSGKTTRGSGAFMDGQWDGRKLMAVDAKGQPKEWLAFWRRAIETKWRRITTLFNRLGESGPESMHACMQANPFFRFDAAVNGRYEMAFYASPILGDLHMKGADFGHMGFGRADMPLFEKLVAGDLYDYQMYSLDLDIQRGFYSSYLACLDQDQDGLMDTYLLDDDNDGLYEKRMWYDAKSKNLRVSNGSAMATARHPLEFPQESIAVENYPKLSALFQKITAQPGLLDRVTLKPVLPSPLGPRLVGNGSFEAASKADKTKPRDWSARVYKGDGRFTLESEGANDGQRYAVVESLSPGGLMGWQTISGTLAPNRAYRLSGWYRAKLESGGAGARTVLHNQDKKMLQTIHANMPASVEWKRFEKTFTTPNEPTSLWISLEINNAKGRLDLDGVKLEETSGSGETAGGPPRVEGLDTATWKIQGPEDVTTIVADIFHAATADERTVLDISPDGFSRLLTGFSRHPCLLNINQQPFSAESLKLTDGVLITHIAKEKPLGPEELAVLKSFVDGGGTLFLALNDPAPEAIAPFAQLAGAFGVEMGAALPEVVSASDKKRRAASRFGGEALKKWVGNKPWERLYFRGMAVKAADGRALVTCDGAALGLVRTLGKGCVYVFGAGDLVSNAFSAYRSRDTQFHCERFPVNNRLIDALADEIMARIPKKGPVTVPAL